MRGIDCRWPISNKAVAKDCNAVTNEVLRAADRTSKLCIDYITAFHAMERRYEPAILMRLGTAKQIDEFDVHGRYARDNRSSSMLTDSG